MLHVVSRVQPASRVERILIAVGAMIMLPLLSNHLFANDVWVDFTSDFHDGFNGSPNGIADWIDELDQGTSDVGIAAFSSAERAIIEANILSDLNTIYAGYNINFMTSRPAGEHDVIYMARDNDHPDVPSLNYGSSPIDVGNQDTNAYSSVGGNPSGVPKVTPANMASEFIEFGDSRATQIAEFSTVLAGTAAHELGHSFGLMHHHVYSHPNISPQNYRNTRGVQNEYLMATSSTGIRESQREAIRELSPFSRVMLDIAGGSDASPSEENNPLVSGHIVSDRTEKGSADAGDTMASAQPLSFRIGPTSGSAISFVEADLDGSTTDIDLFSLSLNAAFTLSAQVFSERLDLSSEFDPLLRLLDSSGALLHEVDDIGWDDDHYNDLSSPEDEEDDPFLVNISLGPGTYYLLVTPTEIDVSDTPRLGDDYWLITSLNLAEEPLATDFNIDFDVDGEDLSIWAQSYNVNANGDADHNGVTDGLDFLLWQRDYSAAPLTMTAAVPETASIWLMSLALVTGSLRWKRT